MTTVNSVVVLHTPMSTNSPRFYQCFILLLIMLLVISYAIFNINCKVYYIKTKGAFNKFMKTVDFGQILREVNGKAFPMLFTLWPISGVLTNKFG